jgi:protein-S-isoprenylcysteine O-methyltransferase Ste14
MPAWRFQALVIGCFVLYSLLRIFFRRRVAKQAAPLLSHPLAATTQHKAVNPPKKEDAPLPAYRKNRPVEGAFSRFLRRFLVAAFILGVLAEVVLLPIAHEQGATWAIAFQERASLGLSELWRWLGLPLALLGLALLAWSHLALHRFWSPEIVLQEDHQIIQEGPYQRIRHPMYTSLFLFFAGVSLLANSLFLLVPALLVSLFLAWRTRAEERLLTAHFGFPYIEYTKLTGRFLPPLRKRQAAYRPRKY